MWNFASLGLHKWIHQYKLERGSPNGTAISPTMDRTVPKIPGKGQISLQGGGARQHLRRRSVAFGVTLPYATAS